MKSFTGNIKSMRCELLQDIYHISLFLELASSNLAQTLLNPVKVIWHHLLNVSVVFVPKNVAFRIELFSQNHNIFDKV